MRATYVAPFDQDQEIASRSCRLSPASNCGVPARSGCSGHTHGCTALIQVSAADAALASYLRPSTPSLSSALSLKCAVPAHSGSSSRRQGGVYSASRKIDGTAPSSSHLVLCCSAFTKPFNRLQATLVHTLSLPVWASHAAPFKYFSVSAHPLLSSVPTRCSSAWSSASLHAVQRSVVRPCALREGRRICTPACVVSRPHTASRDAASPLARGALDARMDVPRIHASAAGARISACLRAPRLTRLVPARLWTLSCRRCPWLISSRFDFIIRTSARTTLGGATAFQIIYSSFAARCDASLPSAARCRDAVDVLAAGKEGGGDLMRRHLLTLACIGIDDVSSIALRRGRARCSEAGSGVQRGPTLPLSPLQSIPRPLLGPAISAPPTLLSASSLRHATLPPSTGDAASPRLLSGPREGVRAPPPGLLGQLLWRESGGHLYVSSSAPRECSDSPHLLSLVRSAPSGDLATI
ncbi:hypothetical protein DFH07DRAFT_954691 [Mycena maculata]|uniref:Uncharacterized protein n=1 Tax=Mycena maculata TaxID=230809 RepID=A0AAD7JQ62_9AGAR|nr:hypothetical protein DFH07DRAFT_954691 [Mycena maculata]